MSTATWPRCAWQHPIDITDALDACTSQLRAQPDRLLRVHDVAQRLDLSVSSIRRLIRTGRLRKVKLNGAVRVRERDLAKLIKRGLR